MWNWKNVSPLFVAVTLLVSSLLFFVIFQILSVPLENPPPAESNFHNVAPVQHIKKKYSAPAASSNIRLTQSSSEELVGAIIADENDTSAQTSHHLLEVLSQLDGVVQLKAAEYAVMLANEHETSLWVRRLSNNEFPAALAEIFFHHLLELDDSLKFQTLAEMADHPSHAMRIQSEEILVPLFGSPPNGVNWVQLIHQKAIHFRVK
jgi:hypothetical protein